MTKKNLIILSLLIICIIVGVVFMVINYQNEKENEQGKEEGSLYQNGVEVFFDTDENEGEWDYIGGDEIPSKGTEVIPKEDIETEAPIIEHKPGELDNLPKYEGDSQVFEGQGDAGIPNEGITTEE